MTLIRRHDASPGAWTIAPWHECMHCTTPLRFHEAAAAEAWLRGFPPEDLRRVALRCDDDASALPQLPDARLIQWLAGRMVAGSVCACDESPALERLRGGGLRRPPPSSAVPAFTPSQLSSGLELGDDLHWVQIELVDTADQPVAGEPYELELPDGEIRRGTLDMNGVAHVGGIRTAGACRVCFPQIDAKEWRAA